MVNNSKIGECVKLDNLPHVCIIPHVTPSHVASARWNSLSTVRYFILAATLLLLLFFRTVPANAEATLTEVVAAINSEKVVEEGIKTNLGTSGGGTVTELLSIIKANTTATNGTIGTISTTLTTIKNDLGGSEAGSIKGELELMQSKLVETVSKENTLIEHIGGSEAGSIKFELEVIKGEQTTALTQLNRLHAIETNTAKLEAVETNTAKLAGVETNTSGTKSAVEAGNVKLTGVESNTAKLGAIETNTAKLGAVETNTAKLGAVESNTSGTKSVLETHTPKLTNIETNTAKLGAVETNTAKLGPVESNTEGTKTAIEHLGSESSHPVFTNDAAGVSVSEFGTGARLNLSEFKEDVETVGWCIIATLMAMFLLVFTFSILRPKRQ